MFVELKGFDVPDCEVATVVNYSVDAGSYQDNFDVTNVAGDVYFCTCRRQLGLAKAPHSQLAFLSCFPNILPQFHS